ncbi:venom acid phosphatase Acph-1-like [Atheta coriaria]|uniref:venom acid phosphatase Acph-1-like n=1 Tax=Dalotia coriaria TaxID=877792 RepID=UPI0031F3C5D5
MLAQILISFKMLVIYKILCPFFFLINFANCELLLTHVLFSSGEVVPLSYPGDVYKNHMHFKQFSGTLTKEGELSSYFLGQQLRTRYDDFLGNIYQTNLSQGYSTYFQASQSSLQCVHLGLYPPQGVQKFESNLNWQPVPYKILKPSYDKFLSPLQFCGKSSWNLPSNMNYSQMYKMLSEKIGQQVTTNEDIYHIYHSFNYQEKNNFHLPQWVEQEESHILKDLEIASTEFFKQLIQERKAIELADFSKK